jgi:hypothetical protein
MKNLNQLKHDHHFQVSVVKSALRIIGCLIAIVTWEDGIAAMALLFLLAELLGVAEEVV